MMKGLILPAAFTVCLDMTPGLWATLKDHFRESVESEESTDFSLIAYATAEIEKFINSVLDQVKDGNNNKVACVQIAIDQTKELDLFKAYTEQVKLKKDHSETYQKIESTITEGQNQFFIRMP